jgi:hypothetical protein
LPYRVSSRIIKAHLVVGTFGGTCQVPTSEIPTKYRQGGDMALTDTFVKNIKSNGSTVGEKHAD